MKKLLVLAVLFTGCPIVPEKPPVPATTCNEAADHMIVLGCLPRADWRDVCVNALQHSVDLHTGCRTKALDCAAVKACGN